MPSTPKIVDLRAYRADQSRQRLPLFDSPDADPPPPGTQATTPVRTGGHPIVRPAGRASRPHAPAPPLSERRVSREVQGAAVKVRESLALARAAQPEVRTLRAKTRPAPPRWRAPSREIASFSSGSAKACCWVLALSTRVSVRTTCRAATSRAYASAARRVRAREKQFDLAAHGVLLAGSSAPRTSGCAPRNRR